jgi:hypothetical protein
MDREALAHPDGSPYGSQRSVSGGAAAIDVRGRRSLSFPLLGRSELGEEEAGLRRTAEQLTEENSELTAQIEDEQRRLWQMEDDREHEEQLIRTLSLELDEIERDQCPVCHELFSYAELGGHMEGCLHRLELHIAKEVQQAHTQTVSSPAHYRVAPRVTARTERRAESPANWRVRQSSYRTWREGGLGGGGSPQRSDEPSLCVRDERGQLVLSFADASR